MSVATAPHPGDCDLQLFRKDRSDHLEECQNYEEPAAAHAFLGFIRALVRTRALPVTPRVFGGTGVLERNSPFLSSIPRQWYLTRSSYVTGISSQTKYYLNTFLPLFCDPRLCTSSV